MLTLPKVVTRHKQDFDVLCDWIEGSLLFGEDDHISIYTIVDTLVDEDIFRPQNDAHAIASDLWAALKLRHDCLIENSPFEITQTRINRKNEWEHHPGYSFCLFLSLAVWTRIKTKWRDYGTEGELFERLTEASLNQQFPQWHFQVVGWSRSNTTSLEQTIKSIGVSIRERELQSYVDYLDPQSKDAGLDLIGYKTFSDKRGALPIFFLQCATGDDWDTKLNTPNLEIWAKIIDFTSKPKRGFAMPFSLLESDKAVKFRSSAVTVGGPFFDRYRLLSAPNTSNIAESWIASNLKHDLNKWTADRLGFLKWE